MASPKIEKVTKVDAVRRQLSTAIRLFFEGRDTVSIHSLVAAAQGIMHDLLKKQGPGVVQDVRTGHQPQDRQGPRPDDPAVAPAASGSGD